VAKKKILLFGGAFDPIHNGHMISALIAREKIGIDQVTLIPCGEAPHKNRKMSKKHRLEMCKKVFYIDASFTVDSYEIRKSSPSYTIETVDFVSRLEEIRGSVADIHWLIGMDAFRLLHTWYKIKELITKCSFVVMCSEKEYQQCAPITIDTGEIIHFYDIVPNFLLYKEIYCKVKVYFVQVPRIDIRSTLIRERIKQGLPIKYLVPDHVERYILINKLYQ